MILGYLSVGSSYNLSNFSSEEVVIADGQIRTISFITYEMALIIIFVILVNFMLNISVIL